MGTYFHVILSCILFVVVYKILSPKNSPISRIEKFIPTTRTSPKGSKLVTNMNFKINRKKNKSIFNKYVTNQQKLLLNAGFDDNNNFKILLCLKLLITTFIIFILKISYQQHITLNILLSIMILIELCSTRYIKYLAKQRLVEIGLELPNVLDFFTILINSGYTIPKMFKEAANELSVSSPIMSLELAKTALEFDLSPDVEAILNHLAERIPLNDIQTLSSILIQTYKFGGGVKESIATLSSDLQNRRLLSIEDKAGKIPNILIMPLIFFILPCLLIVILAPLIVNLLGNILG